MLITLKIDPRMKQALEKVAKKEFSTVSGILKKAAQEYMEKTHGIYWEEGNPEENKK